ncbi:Crp/Fnr family transcriptional regulator [Sphingobacterium oryzagri]|uniref:Crp/Fnr family transcriptional regulator n=1 Tax=Sphingobacterium oryzagri TaxID=3025669 RepID=A0ABY7WP36_9SPHI|nr:Crp/Fnr family transcriptional regulator [Sphingobacterium sp. KACC 22765]WDF70090.1 Crp/Fnr family transcriptional regulator [Sphingobacterium sp. KACC 22765]
MEKNLINHLKKYVAIDPNSELDIANFFQTKHFAKKENLLEFDTTCKYHFFVLQGCLRMFFINDKGVEQTIQFAIENWWLTDYFAFEYGKKTEFIIQAVEPTTVLQIDNQSQEKLIHTFPALERYFRLIFQRAYSASQLRTKYLYGFSREQFYHHFNDNFPAFTQRIPQHVLASFLNMTPEYLSEIKNKSRP